MENKVRFLIREMIDDYFDDVDVDKMSPEELDAFIQFQIDKKETPNDWKKDVATDDVDIPSMMPTDMTNLNEDK